MKSVFSYLFAVGIGAAMSIAVLSPNPEEDITMLDWESESRFLSIYTNQDILYVDVDSLTISYESSDKVERFGSWKSLFARVDKLTALSCVPSGYAEDLRYQSLQGYLTASVRPKLDKDGRVISEVGSVELSYSGTNWGSDPDRDTTFVITNFRLVDKFKTKDGKWYEYVAYNID